MNIQYPIIIEPGNNKTAWGIEVPDIEGCFSASDNQFHILENAREAILGHLECLDEIPKASCLEEFKDKISDNKYLLLVDVDLSKLEGVAKRINVTIPSGILYQIDKAAKQKGVSRSAFLTESAIKAI